MKKKREIDWEAIEREYRAGQLSVREIAKQNQISHTAIQKKAKDFGWNRDLSEPVRRRIASKLLVAKKLATGNVISDTEIIEGASDRGTEVILLHRKDIHGLRVLEKQLIEELKAEPKKLWIGQYQGKIIEKEVGLTVAERAMAANNLANVQHKRIALERQAFSLDEPAKDGEIKLKVIYDEARSTEGD